ncbi:hypothetical protein D3C76_1781090 [compost metagenome]
MQQCTKRTDSSPKFGVSLGTFLLNDIYEQYWIDKDSFQVYSVYEHMIIYRNENESNIERELL